MQPETRYARSADLHIAYQVFGDGPRDLIAALPFLSHLEHNWEHPAVARAWERVGSLGRVVLFNQRGVGLSDPVPTVPTLEERMADMRAVMDAVGARRAVLLGMSDGGPVAMLFAATFPERVEALVLLGTFARRTRADDYPGGRHIEEIEQMLEAIPQVWGTGLVASLTAPSLADDEVHRAWAARLERLAASPGTIVRLARASAETDVRAVLPSVRVPTLVLHRTEDPFYEIDGGRYVAERISGARFIELAGRDYIADADELIDEVSEFLTGTRPSAAPDRVLATVLFTDIVGSTERATELGDRRWRDLLEGHHAVVRRQLQRFQGKEVDTAGDGFLATFDGPARAIHCAAAITEAVRALGLDVRAGIHTGECEVVDAKVGGMAVHIGARVGALAGVGEVLVSSTVKDLVVGSGIEFAARGPHLLKGVPGEWELYSVASAGPT